MKIDADVQDIHSRGVAEKTDYKIAQTSKVMNMLSDMLYKDKIRAVIRELSTNAWDSHVMAKNTSKAPQIHLPNRSDSEFRIRDFGTGLSKVDLKTMYTTYGESNKNHSNDFNGCMGIGSKSPFAYAKSFTTTSYYNGKKYVYVNAKDERDMPTLQLLDESDTTEPNGLEISVAVQSKDIAEFGQKAPRVLQWMPVEFGVKGGENPYSHKAGSRRYSLEGKGWKLRSDTETSCAIMGYVEYPIETEHFFDIKEQPKGRQRDNDWYKHYKEMDYSSGRNHSAYTKLLNLGLELHFEIGEVEMDISREGLQYTDKTIEHIQDRLHLVLMEISAKLSEKFKKCSCMWDARILHNELLRGELSGVRDLLCLTRLQWRGKTIPDNAINSDSLPDELKISTFSTSYRSANVSRQDNVGYIQVNENVTFYENDMKIGNYAACARAMEAGKQLYLVKFVDDKMKKEFFKAVGFPASRMNLCSKVPKPPKEARAKAENVFFFDKNKGQAPVNPGRYYRTPRYDVRDYWGASSVDVDKGGIYVELNAWRIKNDSRGRGGAHIAKVITALNELKIAVPEIAGVKTISVKKFDKSDKWENFFTWAARTLKKHIDAQKIEAHLKDIATLKSFDNDKYQALLTFSDSKIADSNCIVIKLQDEVKKLKVVEAAWKDKAKNIIAACNTLGLATTEGKPSTLLSDLSEKIATEYPVFKLMDGYWSYKDKKKATIVVDMINLIDSK